MTEPETLIYIRNVCICGCFFCLTSFKARAYKTYLTVGEKTKSGGAGEDRTELIGRFFPAGTPVGKIEDTVVKALELYRRRER